MWLIVDTQRRFSRGKVESFVAMYTKICVYASRAVTNMVDFDVFLCYDVCCQVFVCKRRENHHVLLGLLSASTVMLTDFVMLSLIVYKIA